MTVIKYMTEPKLTLPGDLAYNIIEEFSKCKSDQSVIECVKKWKTLELGGSTQLSDWTDVLNKVDTLLEAILLKESAMFHIPREYQNNSKVELSPTELNMSDLWDILTFTSKLLSCSFSKDVYNSTEKLLLILTCYDIEYVFLTMECLYNLTLPPPGHRCDCYLGKHSTQLHKTPIYLLMMFEVIEASYLEENFHEFVEQFDECNSTMVDDVRGRYQKVVIDHERRFYLKKSVFHEIFTQLKYVSNALPSGPFNAKEDLSNLHRLAGKIPQNLIEKQFVVDNVFDESVSLLQVVESSKSVLTYEQQCTLLFSSQMRRCLLSKEKRLSLVKFRFQAVAILLTCYPDTSSLLSFFQNKITLLQDLLYLISNGLVNVESNEMDVDSEVPEQDILLQIRQIACHCLSAAVETRDHNSINIFTQYPWLLHELGVNRGQYMGLFPGIIRNAASFLHEIYCKYSRPSTDSIDNPSQNTIDGLVSLTKFEEQKIHFVEYVLIFLSSLINLHTTIPALNENGVMSALLSIIKDGTGERMDFGSSDSQDLLIMSTGLRRQYPVLLYVDSLALEIIESMLNAQQASLILFREEQGLEVVVNRLAYESQATIYCAYKRTGTTMTSALFKSPQTAMLSSDSASSGITTANSMAKLNTAENIMLQVLFSMIGTFLQELRGDQNNNDFLQTTLARNPAFIESLDTLLTHSQSMVSIIVSALISLVAEIINKDSAPPAILNTFLHSNLVEKILNILSANPHTIKHDLPLTLLGFISAISLTKEGSDLVMNSTIFSQIIQLFHSPLQYLPYSKTFFYDLPINLGNGFEELIRHYPIYLEKIMEAINVECKQICNIGELCIGNQHAAILPLFSDAQEDLPGNHACSFNSEYFQNMQYVISLLTCLEGLFARKSCIEYFLEHDGFDYLLRIRGLSLGSPRYLLTSLACMIDSTVHSIGYSSIETLLHRLMQLILGSDSKKMVLIQCIKFLRLLPGQIEIILKNYWKNYGEQLLLKLAPPLVNLSFPYSKAFDTEGSISRCFYRLLDTLSREPLQQYSDVGTLPAHLIAATNVFRGITMLDYVVELFGLCINPKYNRSTTSISSLDLSSYVTGIAQNNSADNSIPVRTSMTEMELITSELKSAPIISLLQNLLEQFYIPTQYEMTRARGSFITATTQSDCVKVQPIYVLLVVSDTIVIKDSYEDNNSKKIAKLSKGTILYAYERRTNSFNILKYHLIEDPVLYDGSWKLPGDHPGQQLEWSAHKSPFSPTNVAGGWVGVYRNMTTTEPQVIVVDILHKPSKIFEEEYSYNTKNVLTTSQKKFEFEKFANISSRRGGFLSLFHLHYSMKMNLLGGLSRLLYSKDAGPSSISSFLPSFLDHNNSNKGVMIRELANSVLPLFEKSLVALCPIIRDNSTHISEDADKGLTKTTHVSFFQKVGSVTKLDPTDLTNFKMFLDESYNCATNPKNPFAIPFIEDFGTDKVYLAIRVMELAQTMFFDVGTNSRSKHHTSSNKSHPVEANIVFLLQSLYSNDIGVFEKMLEGTYNVFLTAFHPFDASVSSTSSGLYFKQQVVAHMNTSLFSGSDIPPTWHDFTDEYLDFFYEEQLSLQQKNESNASSSQWLLFQKYREYRLAVRERRLLAFSSLDGIIDVWRQCLNFINTHTPPTTSYHGSNTIGSNLSGIEKAFVNYLSSNSEYYGRCYYHPELFKRYLYCVLMKYLLPVFSHPLLPVLPPTLVKNIVDLLNLSIKVGQDIKTWDVKTPSQYYVVKSNLSDSTSMETTDRRSSARRTHQNATASAAFSASEETVVALIDMGFERSDIVRAITAHRTNNIMQLVSILIENPPPPSPAYSSIPSTERANADTASNNIQNSTDNLSQMIQQDLPSFVQESETSPADNAMRSLLSSMLGGNNTSSNSRNATSIPSFLLSLPMVPMYSDEELTIEKAFVHKMTVYLQNIAPVIFFSLIEHGPALMADLMDLDLYNQNISVTKEVFTMQLMTQMLKLFDGYSFTEQMVLSIQVIAFYKESLRIMEPTDESIGNSTISNVASVSSKKKFFYDETKHRLGGLLHSIIVLLSSKIVNLPNGSYPQRGNNATTSCELIQFLIRQDVRYSFFHTSLLNVLEETLLTPNSPSNFLDYEPFELSWIAPAILLLDMIHQAFLVDHETIKTTIREMEYRFANGNRSLDYISSGISKDRNSSRVLGLSIDDMIPPEMRTATKSVSKSSSKISDLLKDNTKEEVQNDETGDRLASLHSPEASQSMPLLSSGLTLTQQIQLANICTRLLSLVSNTVDVNPALQEKVNDILRAALQTLIHLQSHETVRQIIQDLKCPLIALQLPYSAFISSAISPSDSSSSILEILSKVLGKPNLNEKKPNSIIVSSNLDGISNMVFTLIQRQFEDEIYLMQSMTAAMKLIFEKLCKELDSSQKPSVDSTKVLKDQHKSVPLKNFLELACPLLYRNQQVFLQLISLRFEVKSTNGALMMYQRETVNPDGKLDDEKSSVAHAKLSMVTGSPTPIKKLKSNEYQSVVTKSEVPELSSASNSSLSTVKRKIYPSDCTATIQSSSSGIVRNCRNIAAQEIVEELCEQIVKKWLFLHRIFPPSAVQLSDGSFNSYLGLSITELLYTLSDLVAAIPAFSTYVCRYRVRQAQAVDFVYSLMSSRVPGIVKSSSVSFPSFVLNGLMLLPQKHQIFSENNSCGMFNLSNRDLGILYSHLEGTNLHDSCYYLFASILSRPNDNRKYLLQELNALFDLKDPVAFMQIAVNVNAAMRHCNLVQSLFCPPENWLQRDSFVLPVKDISQAVFQSGLPKKIIDVFSRISIYHPQCNEFLAAASSPIDTMIRRAQQFSLSFHKELKIKSQSPESAKKPKRSGVMSNIEQTLAHGGHVSEIYSRQRRGTEGSDHSEYLDDGLLLPGGERRLSQAYQDHLVISQEDQMMFNNEQDDNCSVVGDTQQDEDDAGETSDLEPRPHDEDEDRDEDDDDDDILEEIHVEEDDDEDSENHDEDEDESDSDNDDDEPDHRNRSRPHSGEREGGVDEDNHSHQSDNDEDDEMIVDVDEDDEEDNNEDESDEGSTNDFGGNRRVVNAEGFYEEHEDNIDNNLHTEGVEDAMEADDGDEELDDIDDEVDINANSPGNAYLEDGEDIEQMMSNALGLSAGGHVDWTIGGLHRNNGGGNRRSSLREGLHNGRHHRQNVGGSATGATNFAGQILGELLGEDILANNPLISLIDGNEVRVRIDGHSHLSRIPIGASLISSGRSNNPIDPASIFHQLAFEGNNGEDVMGASVPITTSSARIDPRTGALTLSFDGRGSNRSVTPRSPLNIISLQPPLHPLLNVMDARRGRFINHAPGSSGIGSLIAGSFGAPLGRNDPYYVTDARSNNNNSRPNRSSINPRKSMGPLVSNRRWGADIGEIESPDSRVSTLTQRVGKCLHETLGSIPDSNEVGDKKLNSGSSNDISRGEVGHIFLENLASGLRSYFGSNPLETTASGSRTNDPCLEESKEEGELQETKEDDDSHQPSPTDMNVASTQHDATPSAPLLSPSNDVSPINVEENHDDGGDDDDDDGDDDDDDDDDSSATSSNSSNSNDEMDVEEEEVLIPVENSDNSANVDNNATNVPLTTLETNSIPVSAADNNANPVELSVENLEFLDSLPPDLRQEVLLAAEEQFLLSLPLDVQHEARLLREQQIIEEQVFSYARNQSQTIRSSNTTTSVTTAAANANGNTVINTSSQRPDDLAQPTKVAENPRPDQACYISVVGNIECESKFVPFNAPFMLRIFEWLLKYKSERIPSNLLRLLIAGIKYDATRKEMLQCLFQLLLKNDELVKNSIVALDSKAMWEGERRSVEDELVTLTTLNTVGSTSLHYRKLLAVIGFLLKRTDSLVWYDIMAPPEGSHSDFPWLFGCVIQLLNKIVDESPIDLETILHMLEKLCSPFSKLSATQVNKLVKYSITAIGKEETAGEIKASSEESALAAASKEGSSVPMKENEITATKKSRLMPFPKLSVADAKILSNVVSTCDCSSSSRKALMRVLRYISLSDDNWNLLLNELALVGMNLIHKTTIEFQNLHNSLLESLQNEENVVMVMSKPALSNFQVLWEVRLLNTLRLMTVLRSRSGAAASMEADTVSQYMSQIQGGKLWDMLSDCLDIVRELEGIQAVEGADEESSSAACNRTNVNPLQPKFEKSSMLTMRFIPLIECFLTVCAKTMLVRPAEVTHSASSTTELTRVNSMLPGSRFRQSSNFLQMHMELQDEISAKQLLRFAEQNAVLLNIILRHNVHLLESSFAPLVTVPKCRMLLHFDIKRSYFKAKLKRMRQSLSRHGSLRISVRRQRIFEESFQQLRHKSTDDMRRRLSVTFHNEEGMDAGGLTREWYSVLAREIFNANYALFCCTGDNVTFQPNPHSYVNPEHLSYFKFVGRVIGKAICDDQLLDAHFTRSFYKHILGLPVNIQDLEAIEPEYYKSLVQILETPLDLLGLELTFSAEANEFGHISTIDLIPNGREVAVTDDTKHEYVKLIAHHRMTSAIRKQIDAFLEGFHELVPAELISLFDAQELELLISGLPEIDLDDLRGNADYHGYKASDPIINQFWNILKSFSKEEKALFLQFVTGTSKVPLDGFKALQGADGIKRFNIHKAFGSTSILPTAHTCFNQLDLPEYPSEEIMREKLLISIREGSEGFGFA